MLRDHAFFVQPAAATAAAGANAGGANPVELNSKVIELEAEIEKLREQLSQAKSLNDDMWEKMVKKVVLGKEKEKSEISSADSSQDTDESERRRKRGRGA